MPRNATSTKEEIMFLENMYKHLLMVCFTMKGINSGVKDFIRFFYTASFSRPPFQSFGSTHSPCGKERIELIFKEDFDFLNGGRNAKFFSHGDENPLKVESSHCTNKS